MRLESSASSTLVYWVGPQFTFALMALSLSPSGSNSTISIQNPVYKIRGSPYIHVPMPSHYPYSLNKLYLRFTRSLLCISQRLSKISANAFSNRFSFCLFRSGLPHFSQCSGSCLRVRTSLFGAHILLHPQLPQTNLNGFIGIATISPHLTIHTSQFSETGYKVVGL